MRRASYGLLAAALLPACAFAVDGVVVINQSTVTAAGGFPYMITQPGSYKLSGNLIVTLASKDGIDINSDNVTLDLNGFTIAGPDSRVWSFGNGIASANQNITVKNGVVTSFPVGVFLTGTATITDIQAGGNGEGIVAFPNGGQTSGFIIARCAANGNAGIGFELHNATISDSIANANHASGFFVVRSSLIHNVANNNTRYGIITGDNNPSPVGGSLIGNNTMLDNGTDLYVATSSRSQGNNLCTAGSC